MKCIKIILVSVILILTSCSTQKNAINVDDPNKRLTAPENKALVYIVRPQTLGFLINFKVFCDGEFIGATKGKTYIYTVVEPGEHTFLSKAENKREIHLVLEANKTYFFEQLPRMGYGIKARNKFIQLEENEGRDKLQKCKLVKGFSN